MLNNISNKKLNFIIIFLLIIFLILIVFKPLFHPLAFGAIFSGIFYKLFLKLSKLFKNKKNLASFTSILLIFILILLPSTIIVINVSKELFSFLSFLNKTIQDLSIEEILNSKNLFSYYINKIVLFFDIEISSDFLRAYLLSNIKNLSSYSISIFNSWFNNFFNIFFDFFIMLLVIHGIFTYGDKLKLFILDLSPLPKEEEELILKKFNDMNFVSILSNGIGALIQGILAGLAFYIAGIESVILWTLVMIFLAFIPIIGMSLVYIPASIYLFSIGNIYTAIMLFIFCSTLSLIVENWFKSKFIGDKIKVNSILVLLSIIGALSIFGIPGIFYGPIILIIFLTASDIYIKNYQNKN